MTRAQVSETELGQVAAALAAIRGLLACYTFVAPNERDLQRQVFDVLGRDGRMVADREVRIDGGAFDIRVNVTTPRRAPVVVVLELKVRGSAAAVERQAQRYAKTEGVDAVAVVTTSQRLAASLLRPRDVGQAPFSTLGGKPFDVISLRGF